MSRDLASIRSLVSQLLADDSSVATLHPYGFIVFKLNYSKSISLRCHIWPSNSRHFQHPIWPIHSHPETVRSAVIVGTITHRTYKVSEVQRSDYELYAVSYASTLSKLVRTGRYVSATRVSSDLLGPSKNYALAPNIFHSVHVPDSSFACTLALTQRSSTGHAGSVVGRSDYGRDQLDFNREIVDTRIRNSALIELQERLKGERDEGDTPF
jgi:hypothetical protein